MQLTCIANATDFNGIKSLDGTSSGAHDGSGLTSTGKMKIHLGTANDSAEYYYYVTIGNCTAAAMAWAIVDVATEMTSFVRNQILTQAAVAMLGQANSLPQMAMQLIGG